MNINKLTNIVVDAVRSKKDKSNKSLQLAMAINGTYVEDATYDALEYCIVGITEPVSGSQEYTIISSGTGTMDQIVATSQSVNTSSYGTVECFVFMSEPQYGKFVEPLSDSDWTIVLNPEKVEGEGEAWNMLSSLFNGTDYSVDNNKYAFFMYIPTTETPINFQYAGKPYQIVKQEQESSAPTFNCVNYNYTNDQWIHSQFTFGSDSMIFQPEGLMCPYMIFLTEEQHQKYSYKIVVDQEFDQETQEALQEYLDGYPISEMGGAQFQIPNDAAYAIVPQIITEIIFVGGSVVFTYDGVDYTYDSSNIIYVDQSEAPTFDCLNYISGAAVASEYQLGDTVTVDGSNGGIPNMTPYALFLTDEEYAKFSLSLQFSDDFMSGSTQEEIAAAKQSAEEEFSPKLISSLDGGTAEAPQDATYVLIDFSSIATAIYAGNLESATITYDGVDYVYDSSNTTVLEQLP